MATSDCLSTSTVASRLSLSSAHRLINLSFSLNNDVVLSLQAIERTNYLCLYGLHEKYLNNLLSRYSEGLISDLFT